MPITPFHPGAAIPFKKIGLLVSPLIIGSMTPDFEFFIMQSGERIIAHSWAGIFIFCVPAGLIILALFHFLLKRPVVSLLPYELQVRLLPHCGTFKFFPMKRLLLIVASLVAGSATHLVLDSFTHEEGWIAGHIPMLSLTLIALPLGAIKVYFILQYALSAICLLCMWHWYRQWYQRTAPPASAVCYWIPRGKKTALIVVVVAAALGGGVGRFFSVFPDFHIAYEIGSALTVSFIGSTSAVVVVMMIFCILWRAGGIPVKEILHPDNGIIDVTAPIPCKQIAGTLS